MATGTFRFSTGRSKLRRVVSDYVDLIGPGGLTAYVAPQDLLVITDFNSLLVLRSAEKYVKAHRLRAVAEFVNLRKELPGAHILDESREEHPTDIRYKSILSDRSIYVMELIALAKAQQSVPLEERIRLTKRYKSRRDPNPVTTLSDHRGVSVLIGDNYYNTLLNTANTRMYSGVQDHRKEPTLAWRDLRLSEKGVFFAAGGDFYGLVMPHAYTNTYSGDDSGQDQRPSSDPG